MPDTGPSLCTEISFLRATQLRSHGLLMLRSNIRAAGFVYEERSLSRAINRCMAMPVSEERLAQIRELSNDERVDRLDTSGFEDADWQRLDAELNKETIVFCRGNRNAEELHAFADTWNWDKGTWALEEILDNPACEAATALLIYWRSAPEYYRQYADRAALVADPLAAHAIAPFDFLAKLEARYVAGTFPVGSIAFDPADPADNRVGIYDDLRDKFVRELPRVMYAPVRPTSVDGS